MADVNYYLRFGTGDPSNNSGLSPTFTSFRNEAGGATTAPSISEVGSEGVYTFAYDPQGSINFVCDGATTGLAAADRYIVGSLDISDRIYELGTSLSALGTTNVALGTTNVALGTSNIALGTTNVALGTTNVALGTSNIALGTTAIAQGSTITGQIGVVGDAIGDSSTAPTTVFGFINRIRQWLEGQSTYTKASGVLVTYELTGATTLSSRTIADSTDTVAKT